MNVEAKNASHPLSPEPQQSRRITIEEYGETSLEGHGLITCMCGKKMTRGEKGPVKRLRERLAHAATMEG